MVKDDRTYLLHILECIGRIEEAVRDGRAVFDASHVIQDAVMRNLQVMAESTQRLSSGLKADHSEIDWVGIAGFRNVLVHDYFGVDLDVVWQIAARDLPTLKTATLRMLV